MRSKLSTTFRQGTDKKWSIIRQQTWCVYLLFFLDAVRKETFKFNRNQMESINVCYYPSCSNSIVRFSSVCWFLRSKAPRARDRRGFCGPSARRFVYTSSSLCRGIFFTSKHISLECNDVQRRSLKCTGSQPIYTTSKRRLKAVCSYSKTMR